MLSTYRELAAAREAQGVPALPLNAEQTQGLTELLQNLPPARKRSCCTCSANGSPRVWMKPPT